MFNLSKSKYCYAKQCPKMLWLKTFKNEEFDDSVLNQAILTSGSEVGDLAMNLFGDFQEVEYTKDYSKMQKDTEEFINKGVNVIAEASFITDGLFCSVDILKNLGDKNVEIYEVKSSTEIKEIYYDDLAFQCYVVLKSGYNIKKTCIVHINNEYVRQGEININELFKIEEIDISEQKLKEVENNIEYFKKYLEQTEEPQKEITENCFSPYGCGFFEYCTKTLPKPNIFDVHGARLSTKLKNFYNNAISFEAISQIGNLSPKQFMQVLYEINNLEPHIETKPIKAFLDKFTYPLYFLDFESFNPAIPQFDNSKPYEQIVFQYSLHYIESIDGELKHKEFLAYPKGDPRRSVAEHLCEDIPLNVCTLAYNKSFEQTQIKKLAQIYPDLSSHLMNIHDNIIDLMMPFQSKLYYTKEMQGSYSIKYVLPALFPDDRELNYANLEGVHNGSEASAAFKEMQNMNAEEVEEKRKQLLKYCGLDTYAMVKIWQKLLEVTSTKS